MRHNSLPPALAAVMMAVWVLSFWLGAPQAISAKPKPSPTPSAEAPSPAPAEQPPAAPAAAPAPVEQPDNKISSAAAALAKAQTLLEFYYMETGSYPETMEDMLTQYNQGVKQNEPMVRIPTDPATGKKLVYQPNSEKNGYILKVPDASLYGTTELTIHQLDWGWMSALAAEQKKRRLMITCGRYQEVLVGIVNEYNKSNRNKFPDSLDQLIPKYLKTQPLCPATNKPFVYTHDSRGFEVACPNPAAHGLEIFRFSSTEGPKRYP